MGIVTVLTDIRAPIDRVFDLARSIDLHVESAGATGEKAIGTRTSGLLALNDEVTWRGRHFGVWQKFTSRITSYNPPEHFRDSMVQGAFKCMDHDHYFGHHKGVTTMHDAIEFVAPFGVLGAIVDKLLLQDHLRRFLAERNEMLKRVAEGDEWSRFLAPR